MSDFTPELRRFSQRVRLVRSWRGLALGACFGAACSAVWAALDWAGVAFADWPQLAALVGASALTGAIMGFGLKVPSRALAMSIDRRAGLEDRLSTAMESRHDDG